MKNTKCPSRRFCCDYTNGNCDNCATGAEIIKLHKRIERLKKRNETLTIKNEMTKANTIREMHTEIKNRCTKSGIYPAFVASTINQIAKEMMGGKDENT